MDEDEVAIVLKWREEGRAILDQNKLALAELNAALAYRDALRASGVIGSDAETVATQTNTVATAENADAQVEDAAATDENAASQAGLADLLSGITIPAWITTTVVILAAAAALSPFIIGVGSAIVIAVAFGVAATGMALAVTGATLSIVGLLAGVVLLADKFAWVNNSMNQFKGDLNEMGINLARLAAPAANQVLQFLDSFIPKVQSVGIALISWLDPRVPEFLRVLGGFGNSALGGLSQVGAAIGGAIDQTAGSGQLNKMFQQFTDFGAGALVGLVQNLLALSNWFEQRLPTYGPVAQQIFGALGTIVQAVAGVFGKFADWLVANWPTISDMVSRAVKAIGDAWNTYWPQFQPVINQLGSQLVPAIQNVANNMGVWVPVILTLVAAFLGLFDAITTVVGLGMGFLTWLGQQKAAFVDFANTIIEAINRIIDAYDSLPWVQSKVPEIPTLSTGAIANTTAGGGNQAAQRRLAAANGITININGAGDPQKTGRAVVQQLRRVTQQ